MTEDADIVAEDGVYEINQISKIGEAKYLLDLMMRYRKQSDDKANIVLAIFGVIATAIVMMGIQDIIGMVRSLTSDASAWAVLILTTITISVVIFLIGFGFLVYVVYPNTSTMLYENGEKRESDSILYFKGIAKREYTPFMEEYKGYSNNDYLDDLLEEVHFTAKVCEKRFRDFQIGLVLSVAGIGLLIAGLLAGFIFV